MSNGKVALIILDGYGIGEPNDGNAIYMAQTPVMDGLLQRWPHTKLSASGLDVGLPDGQMGNSEVGHTNRICRALRKPLRMGHSLKIRSMQQHWTTQQTARPCISSAFCLTAVCTATSGTSLPW